MDLDDNDDVYEFNKVELISTNGKFYMEQARRKSHCFEVSEEQFRLHIILMYNNRHQKTFNQTFEYLLSQLEMTPTLFQATLFGTWV